MKSPNDLLSFNYALFHGRRTLLEVALMMNDVFSKYMGYVNAGWIITTVINHCKID